MHGRKARPAASNAFTACGSLGSTLGQWCMYRQPRSQRKHLISVITAKRPPQRQSDRGRSDVATKLTRIKNVQSKAPSDLAMLEIAPKIKFQPKSRQHRPITCISAPGQSLANCPMFGISPKAALGQARFIGF
jgi:hypothetical protein